MSVRKLRVDAAALRARPFPPKLLPAAEFTACFWNVENLFDPQLSAQVRRGPQTRQERDAKLDRVAQVLNNATRKGPPALLGLAEIQSQQLVDQLEQRLDGQYHTAFESATNASRAGLAVMTRKDIFAPPLIVGRDQLDTRPFGILALCQLANTSLLFGVNHWPSKFKSGATTDIDRERAASWLGESVASWERDTPFLLLGDFNCEPFELPLNCADFRGMRFVRQLTNQSWLTSVYNTAWGFLSDLKGQPHTSVAPEPGRVARARILDQLLVSRSLITGARGLRLNNATVEFLALDGVNSAEPRPGVPQPLRWSWDGATGTGASDHYPLIAMIEVEELS